MNDKELADRIVALGALHYAPAYAMNSEYWQIPDTNTCFGKAGQAVRDWRVAGALMEKLLDKQDVRMAMQILDSTTRLVHIVGQADGQSESLPRAINEACVEALDD